MRIFELTKHFPKEETYAVSVNTWRSLMGLFDTYRLDTWRSLKSMTRGQGDPIRRRRKYYDED
jgi:hypothetical protein